MPSPQKYPVPGTHDLRSGDLLFPKNPKTAVVAAIPDGVAILGSLGYGERHSQMSFKSLMNSDKAEDLQLQQYLRLLQMRMQNTLGLDFLDSLSGLGIPLMIYLYQLLFEEISDQMTPVFKSINLTFGHSAMVFEEDSQWFVAEAGCTDYSHYRVCIAPYWDAEDAQREVGQMRGWASRRAALGQYTWTARHKDLKSEHLDTLLAECKNWLSVPYGILEPGMMHNPDRIYCSELLVRAFKTVNLSISANQNWQWVIDQLMRANVATQLVLTLLLSQIKTKFPLLSPKMIYDSKKEVTYPFKPVDAQGKTINYL
jgi:hypothetical protein